MGIFIIDIEKFSAYFKLLHNEVYKFTGKAQADILNILIYIWILLSAVVVCSVYFWTNNELGSIKIARENEVVETIPDLLELATVGPTRQKRVKIKSTTVKMHRMNKSVEYHAKETVNPDKLIQAPSQPAAVIATEAKGWANAVIRFLFNSSRCKQRISAKMMEILNEILDNSTCHSMKVSVISVSFGSRLPQITDNVSEAEENLSFFSCCVSLLIPQLVIAVSFSDTIKEDCSFEKCMINISELLLKINIENYFTEEALKTKISFHNKVIAHSHIEAPNMDAIALQLVKHEVCSAFDKGVFELEFRIDDGTDLLSEEVHISHHHAKDKSTSPRTILHFDTSLLVDIDPSKLDTMEQDKFVTSSMEKNGSRQEKLLTIHYVMIPFLISERLDEIFLVIHIDNPKQYYKSLVSSFRKTETGIENIFACVNATFFIGQPSAVLKFILQTENSLILRSGQIHVTEHLQDSISFLSMNLHLPIERENDFIFSTNMEFATLSVIFSSSCLYKANRCDTLLSDEHRLEFLRTGYRKLDNIEDEMIGQMAEYSTGEDFGDNFVNFINSQGLVVDHKEIEVMINRENHIRCGKHSDHNRKVEWYKRLPTKAFQKCKTKLYGKIQMEKRTLFSVWNHRSQPRKDWNKQCVSMDSIPTTEKLRKSHLYNSAPNVVKSPQHLKQKVKRK